MGVISKVLNAIGGMFREGYTPSIYDVDESSWQLVGGAGAKNINSGKWTRKLDELNDQRHADEWYAEALVLSRTNPLFRGEILNHEKYVVGDGPMFHHADDTVMQAARDAYKAIGGVRWAIELCRRFVRDGEVFCAFPNGTARFIDPAAVRTPPEEIGNLYITRGVEVSPEDTGEVVAYHIRVTDTDYRRIPADEMLHVMDCADENELRGWSRLENIAPICRAKVLFSDERMTSWQIGNSVFLVRRGPAGGTTTRNLAEGGTTSDAPSSGSILRVGPNVEYQYVTPNMNSGDAAKDARELTLLIAAGTTQSEYLVSGDVSNGNYSSTMIAEAQNMLAFMSVRRALTQFIVDVVERVAGVVGAGLSVRWPSMRYRTWEDEVNALRAMVRELGLSPETALRELGYEYDVEVARTAENIKAAPAHMIGNLLQQGGVEGATEGQGECGHACGDRDYAAYQNLLDSAREALHNISKEENNESS